MAFVDHTIDHTLDISFEIEPLDISFCDSFDSIENEALFNNNNEITHCSM